MIKKLFSPVFLVFSLLLLAYVLYKSEIIFLGTNREHYFKYYILCFILIILSICTFYINKKTKEYFSIIILTLIFSSYLFEYYLSNSLMNKEELQILKIKKKMYNDKTGKIYYHMSPRDFPEEWDKLLQIVEGLHGFCKGFDYSLQLKYEKGVYFSAHYDSKKRWEEFIVGVNLNSEAELYFTKKGFKSI